MNDNAKINLLPGGYFWAKAKIVRIDDGKLNETTIALTRGDLYSVQSTYSKAHESKNPLLAPHGLLRSLRYGEKSDLIQFLATFGPLEWHWEEKWSLPNANEYARQHADEIPLAHVNIAEFWACQIEFTLIAGLWEAWSDVRLLQDAYVNLALNRVRLAHDVWTVMVPYLKLAAGLEKLVPHNRANLWSRPSPRLADTPLDFEAFIAGLRKQPIKWLRHWAAILMQHELCLHSEKRKPAWASFGEEKEKVYFKMSLDLNTLWEAVWEMFGQDTAKPLGWRICPHCGKLFYPPRKDRVYCTSEQQALASKREWARRFRSALKGESKSRA